MPVIYSCPSFKSFAGIALICAVPAIAACDRQSEAPPQQQASGSASSDTRNQGESPLSGKLDRSKQGTPIPDVTIALPGGSEQSLAAFKGTPLLVNLWATWCGPCKIEMPMLDQLAADTQGKLKVVTVSQDLDTQKVPAWFEEQGFKHLEPWLEPENDLTMTAYATGVLPTTVLYDAQGNEVWRMVGEYEWSGPEAAELVAEAFQGR